MHAEHSLIRAEQRERTEGNGRDAEQHLHDSAVDDVDTRLGHQPGDALRAVSVVAWRTSTPAGVTTGRAVCSRGLADQHLKSADRVVYVANLHDDNQLGKRPQDARNAARKPWGLPEWGRWKLARVQSQQDR